MKTYRVLVVDDKAEVLEQMQNEIKHEVTIGDEDWKIDIIPLHVIIGGDDKKEQYFIEESTIMDLARICKKPFDLILLDFGYTMKNSDIVSRVADRTGEEFNLHELDSKLLNPNDLIKASVALCNKKKNWDDLKNITKNFINHRGELIIYTYIPPKLKHKVHSKTVRENITHDSFGDSKVDLVDTSLDLFNEEKFADRKTEQFYAYLISKYLEKIIHLKIAEKLIEKSKYIKVKNTTKAIGFIILVGGLIGAISEYVSGLIIRFWENQYILPALILFSFIIIVVILSGKMLINFLEKRLNKLFMGEQNEDF